MADISQSAGLSILQHAAYNGPSSLGAYCNAASWQCKGCWNGLIGQNTNLMRCLGVLRINIPGVASDEPGESTAAAATGLKRGISIFIGK